MPIYTRALLALAAIAVLFGLYFIFKLTTANEAETRLRADRPLGIRIALLDDSNKDSLEVLLQAIIFPKNRQVCFYFVNTDAFYADEKKPIREMRVGAADRFSSYTGVKSDYYIYLKKSAGARILDLMEGLPFFLEEPIIFENAEFQYPQGFLFFSGMQIMEYSLARRKVAKGDAVASGIDRLFRQESVLLSLFGQIAKYRDLMKAQSMGSIALSLLDTNLTLAELSSLADALSSMHANVLEVPLEAIPSPQSKDPKLAVRTQGAKNLFNDFTDNLASNQLRKNSFTLEVLNGTETKGMARRVKQYLQELGPMVLTTDNYDYKPLERTVILDRAGNTYHASVLAGKTGTPRSQIFFNRRAMQVNLTIIIGTDFKIKKLRL